MENDSFRFHDRDVSWLSFNKRVLMEAADPEVPIYERVKFLAIYSSNLDEYFRVRVAALRSIVDIDKKKINKKFHYSPKDILNEILKEVLEQLEEFGHIKRDQIIPELKKNGITLYRDEAIKEEHRSFVEHYFKSKVLSYLQPIIMTSKTAKTPYLDNLALYFAIELIDGKGARHYAHLKIPTEDLPRFIELPEIDGHYYFIAIDDIIRECIDFLFPGYEVKGAFAVKLNRDADLNIEDEYSGNLVKKIKKQINKRNLGVPSRFLYDSEIPEDMLSFLKKTFGLKDEDLVKGGKYHNMDDLFGLKNPKHPHLENTPLKEIRIRHLEEPGSIFDCIDAGEIMLHFPYQSYDYVLRFFNEAALNPDVVEIKATFYRIAPNSFISNALISAANNGKKVFVFVEIKARFDEENNLKWAEKMKAAGIEIIYSIPGLKVHAKVALVKKKTEGKLKSYAFFGTGNFNEKTAAIYADEALLSAHGEMTAELDEVFEYLGTQQNEPEFRHLLVSQFNITEALENKIDREIENVKNGGKGYIILKLNNIQDDIMISKLYEASQAGVKIELVIRAICCVIPGIKGMSENITVRRIVDRYLEHSRVYYFHNNGKEEYYLGSADWMKRNLYRRVEVVFPIYNTDLRKQIKKMIDLQLADNVKACFIDEGLKNIPIKNGRERIQSQVKFHSYLKAIS